MQLRRHASALLLVLLCCLLNVRAQDEDADDGSVVHMKNSEGTDFWLCFMRNYREGSDNSSGDQLTLQLFFTANETSNITIDIAGMNYSRALTVVGGTVASMVIDEKAQLNSVATPQKLAIHIQSEYPISVYGLNRRFQTTDTYLALPVSVLGTEYRAMCYNKLSQDLISQVAVVATEDNTEITVVPKCQVIGGFAEGRPYKMRMQRGEAYQMIADFLAPGSGDLTGTLITSNKKISVFSGHSCAYVPSGTQACNHLVEQLPPVSAWGKHFYVGMLKGRSRYTMRVLAHEERTKVFEDTKLVAVLGAGEFYENLNVRKHLQIKTDKPVLVAQYSQGFKNGDSIGDPMMILISPTQQFVNRYRIATPVNGYWDHFMNVVVPTEKISTLRLDGKPIPATQFETLGLSRYSLAQIKVDFGTHVIHGSVPFGLYLYGFGYSDDGFDAYGNMGGQSFYDLDYGKDTLKPIAETVKNKTVTNLVIRDDRNSDLGLKSVSIVSSVAMATTIPQVDEGAPQVSIPLRPMSEDFEGKLVIRAVDMAGNTATYTVCYLHNSTGRGLYFRLCAEGEDCNLTAGWSFGAFIIYNAQYHVASFSQAGNVAANGKFGDAYGNGGFFGVSATRRLDQRLALTARLSIETIGGTIHAPDSVVLHVRDSAGILHNFQEERSLSVSAPVIGLAFLAEYSIMRYLYLLGGAKAMLLTSNAVNFKRRILLPPNTVYSDIQQPERDIPINGMDALETLRVGFLGGAGFSVPVSPIVNVFLESEYWLPVNSLINVGNGTWNTSSLTVNMGLRVRF